VQAKAAHGGVKREINQKGKVAVDFATVPSTANPPDYTQ
jgi:hypothetical protein